MELPNLGEFKALLQDDRIFRDYLNAFLNLPVSCTTKKATLRIAVLHNIHLPYSPTKRGTIDVAL